MSSGAHSDGRGSGPPSVPTPVPTLIPLAPSITVAPPPLDPVVVECVHATECAGCPLIHLDYAQQLTAKRARVVTAVGHYPALELVYTHPLAAAEPAVGYRGRAKLIVSPKGRVGLYARSGNHEVVDIPGCRVLTPALASVASALRALIADPPGGARALLLPFDPLGGGVLRAVDLREARSPSKGASADRIGVLVTFVLQRERSPSRDELAVAARALRPLLPDVLGVAANFHEGDAPQILGPDTVVLDGAARAEDRIGGTYHLATYGSFVQAHRDQAARIHALIAQEIGNVAPKPRVLDLYGGSGAISLALAKAGSAVTMVESFGPAAAQARTAAEAQGLQLDVRTGDVADAVAQLASRGAVFDAVVMNPPRRGVSPPARESIAKLGAPVCVYVSCEPDTLARDLDHLNRLGYAATELAPFDMIPLTEEVETVCVLRRSAPAAPRVLYEDEDVIVVEKGPHEPVARDDGTYGSTLIQRCGRIPGLADTVLIPVHDLEAGTSGLCVLARSEGARAAWAAALSSNGRLVYLAAAKSITPAKGAITRDLREGGRPLPARTRYRRLAIASGHSVLRVIPDGGRTHQIRRHLAAIGHPVLGDERYGHLPTNRYFEEKHGLDRSFLHLVRVEIVHPRTGARLLVESTLPGDLRAALERATGSSVLRFLEQKHALGDQRTSSIPPPSIDEGLGDMPPSSRASFFPESLRGTSIFPPESVRGASSSSSSIPPGEEPPADSRRVPYAPSSRPDSLPPSFVTPDLDESPRTIRRTTTPEDED